mgnify:FL=1
MIDKRIGFFIILLSFFISFFVGYSIAAKTENQEAIFEVLQKNFFQSENISQPGEKRKEEPKTEVCPLNGALYSKTQRDLWEKRRPLGIMVENHVDARPQSGLSAADIVYEAVAEGGITRFLAIFYCQDAEYVGPVRSARIYFIKLLEEYGDYPLYAHVGGANTPGPADALGEIRRLGWANYNDLNQFSVPFPNFWRDYERLPNRATEHTVYTSTTKLWQYAASKRGLTNVDEKGNLWSKKFQSWQFQDDISEKERGDLKTISFEFWNIGVSNYSVKWQYDKVTNSFKRFNGGSPHLDKNTLRQLEAKNIVVIFTKESPANDGYEGGHLLYEIVGQGKGIVFQNGRAVDVNWKKPDEKERMTFYDKNGEEISFVRGPIWIEILPLGNKVDF